ncbi:MAG: SMI1/KNR4 family protein [Gordonia paraffinivorans]
MNAALDALFPQALTFRPPASGDQLRDSQSATTGASWPRQLVDFYQLHDGQEAEYRARAPGELLPASRILPCDEMVEHHQAMVDHGRWELYDDPWLRENAENSEAGARSFCFLTDYVPIAQWDSDYYFVDTRPGPQSGCVRYWARDDGDASGEVLWPSLAEMLADIRRSIVDDAVLLEPFRPWFVHDRNDPDHGVLTWVNELSCDLDDAPPPPVESTPLLLPFPVADYLTVMAEYTGPFLDLDAVRRQVLDTARALHPGTVVEGGETVYQPLPRHPGVCGNALTTIDGELIPYLVVITGEGDDVLVFEHPPGGFTIPTTNDPG